MEAKKESKEEEKSNKKDVIAGEIWEIKKKYSGGDRVLEYCLDSLKGNKNTLLEHLLKIQKAKVEPTETIECLKTKIQSISGENAQKYELLNKISLNLENIETDEIFSKEIVGNENSSVSALITELKNSDWVKAGLKYQRTKIHHKHFKTTKNENQTIILNSCSRGFPVRCLRKA